MRIKEFLQSIGKDLLEISTHIENLKARADGTDKRLLKLERFAKLANAESAAETLGSVESRLRELNSISKAQIIRNCVLTEVNWYLLGNPSRDRAVQGIIDAFSKSDDYWLSLDSYSIRDLAERFMK